MKYCINLLITALACSCMLPLSAQTWTRNITSEQPTFFEIQQAFKEHWEPYHVQDGWYIDNDGIRRKAFGWNPFKRWEYYWETRVGPTGEFPSNTVQCDAWNEHRRNRRDAIPKAFANWTSLGPFSPDSLPGVGRTNCVAFHPTDASTFWVGTPAGGIWKTTDGGNSWSTNTDDLPVLGVSWIAVHPIDPDILYIATGDGDLAFALGSAFGHTLSGDTKSIGILKSTDGGSTWTNVLSFDQSDGITIRKVMMVPGSPNMLYAATSMGIVHTMNGGANWATLITGHFIDMEFHPTDPAIIYASNYDTNGDAQVHVSNDAGQTWIQTTSFVGDVGRIELAVSPAAPNNVDLIGADNWVWGMHTLQRSTDSGNTWTEYMTITNGLNLLGSSGDASDAGGQGWYDLTLTIDPNDANNIFVGGINLWRTSDGGTNWSISNMWTDDPGSTPPPNVQVTHADKHQVAYHPLLANTLIECNDGGVYKSSDAGTTWTDISAGIVNSQIYSISSSQNGTELLAGLQDNGSVHHDQGIWSSISAGDGMRCHFDPSDPNYRYTSSQRGYLYRSVVNPPSFTRISDSIPGGQPYGSWLTPYVLDPSDPTTLFAGYISVHRSDDRGDSWVQLGAPFILWMKYLEVAATDNDRLYAGQNSSIKRSMDGGVTWTTISSGLPTPSVYISGFTIDALDADGVVLTLSGYAADEKVYVTGDGGNTWVNITGTGLPNLPVSCSVIDPSTGTIYVGTDAGVFSHDALSGSWTPFNTGLPNVVITDLEIVSGTSTLRAGTFGRGLWESSLLSVGMSEELGSAGLVVAPNPNSGSFTVSLSYALEQVRDLWLVNSMGQEVLRDASVQNDRGNMITVDANGLPPGVYLLNARTSRGLRSSRVVVE